MARRLLAKPETGIPGDLYAVLSPTLVSVQLYIADNNGNLMPAMDVVSEAEYQLDTTAKKVVPSINELQARLASAEQSNAALLVEINLLKNRVAALEVV